MLARRSCDNPVWLPGRNQSTEILVHGQFYYRRRYYLIVAYSRARRLSEVSLEQDPEAFLRDRLVDRDLSRSNRCVGDFLDVISGVYFDRRMGRTFNC